MERRTIFFNLSGVTVAWAVVWKGDEPVGIIFLQGEGLNIVGSDKVVREIMLFQNAVMDAYTEFFTRDPLVRKLKEEKDLEEEEDGEGHHEEEGAGEQYTVKTGGKNSVAFARKTIGSYELEYVGVTIESVLNGLVPRMVELFWNEEGKRLYFLIYDGRKFHIASRGMTEDEVFEYMTRLVVEGEIFANLIRDLS